MAGLKTVFQQAAGSIVSAFSDFRLPARVLRGFQSYNPSTDQPGERIVEEIADGLLVLEYSQQEVTGSANVILPTDRKGIAERVAFQNAVRAKDRIEIDFSTGSEEWTVIAVSLDPADALYSFQLRLEG